MRSLLCLHEATWVVLEPLCEHIPLRHAYSVGVGAIPGLRLEADASIRQLPEAVIPNLSIETDQTKCGGRGLDSPWCVETPETRRGHSHCPPAPGHRSRSGGPGRTGNQSYPERGRIARAASIIFNPPGTNSRREQRGRKTSRTRRRRRLTTDCSRRCTPVRRRGKTKRASRTASTDARPGKGAVMAATPWSEPIPRET